VTVSAPPQFHELAEYYDALNDRKDYRREAERLDSIVQRIGRRGGRKWLDVACGTGRHLEFLRRTYSAVGLDESPEMLRIARRRLPGVRLVRADMRTFRLKDRFDVVTCLFGAIGHLRTQSEVGKTFDNFARHLSPGGVAIIEPWIDPADFRPGMIDVRTSRSPTLTAVRCAFSVRRRDHSIIHWHFLLGQPGRGIRYCREIDTGLLLSQEELLRLMRRAGLLPRFLSRGLVAGRGLLVGVKFDANRAS